MKYFVCYEEEESVKLLTFYKMDRMNEFMKGLADSGLKVIAAGKSQRGMYEKPYC